jgi:putative glutathione S-transferase
LLICLAAGVVDFWIHVLCFLAAPHLDQMARSALDEVTDTGAFDRSPSTFRSSVSSDASARFPAVPGRYHLYVSYACPWASRCLAFLKLKGLDHAIGVTVIPTSRAGKRMCVT